MNKKLPRRLFEKQELQRQQTVNRVLRAIVDIKADGNELSIKNLAIYSGLSRSVLAKSHVQEQLVLSGISKPQGTETGAVSKKKRQHEMIAEMEQQIHSLQLKNSELKNECELLRGHLFLLMQKLGKN